MTAAYTRPILIGQNGEAHILQPLQYAAGAGEDISERWLQEILFVHPECIPLREIDASIGPLIPVCMELETGAGPADILYVSPLGQIVLVETKLWRNPEARRQVVGQVLDYAKQLTAWTFDVLDQKASMAAKASSGHLLRCLVARHPDANAADFVDGIDRNLRAGEFLLLIAGDGIRSGAESLVGFLERYGHLKFGLALVEVARYTLPDGSTLVQPRVLARTEILQRTMLVGPTGPVAFQQEMAIEDEALSESLQSQRQEFTRFWSEFLKALRAHDPALADAEPTKSTNQIFTMPPYGGRAWVSAYLAKRAGYAGVYLTFPKNFALAPEFADRFEADRQSIERELGAEIAISRTGNKIYIGAPRIYFSDINGSDRPRVIKSLADLTRRFVAVFKPRLEAAVAEQQGSRD